MGLFIHSLTLKYLWDPYHKGSAILDTPEVVWIKRNWMLSVYTKFTTYSAKEAKIIMIIVILIQIEK